MSNEDRPITSRRERRLAQQAALASAQQDQLTPAQAEAEARARAEAEAAANRARSEALAAAHGAAAEAARGGTAPSAVPTTGRAEAGPTRRPRPGDAERATSERSSQARARDRAAQRVLRELAEKEQAAQNAQHALPTRRSIRERETGKIPPVRIDSEAPQTGGNVSGPEAQALPVVPRPEESQRPAARRAPVPGVDPAPPTAMQGIVPQGLTVTPALGPETGSFRRLSHEQIAAARELLKEQAKNQAAMLEAQRGAPGTEVDPALLAEQVAMAERAAVLNRRAQAKQRLAEESRKEASAPPKKAPEPAATDNLAMVTPLEFVRVPGVPHPVMKPPTTTHVPVVTGKTVRQPRPGAAPRPSGQRGLPEAAPVAARSAHGLDPLGAAQAGAGRADRERLILLSIGAIGIIALIIAIIMIVLGSK